MSRVGCHAARTCTVDGQIVCVRMEADLVSPLQPRVKSRLRADPVGTSGDIHSVALVVPSAAGSGLFVGFRIALDASPWLGGHPWHSTSG